jgi:hypothetical protein
MQPPLQYEMQDNTTTPTSFSAYLTTSEQNLPALDWVEQMGQILGLEDMPHIFWKERDRLQQSSEEQLSQVSD